MTAGSGRNQRHVPIRSGPRINEKARMRGKVAETRMRIKNSGLGFTESKNKPGLFYLVTDIGPLFLDTREDDPYGLYPYGRDRPLIYFKPTKKGVAEWQENRLKEEWCSKLFQVGVVVDYSVGYRENGYCHRCGKDMSSPGFFCPECRAILFRCEFCGEPIDVDLAMEKTGGVELDFLDYCQCWEFCKTDHTKQYYAREVQQLNACEICGQKIVLEDWCGLRAELNRALDWQFPRGYKHHVSYEPEETIYVCPSCHIKIHHSSPGDELYKYNPARLGQSRKEYQRLK